MGSPPRGFFIPSDVTQHRALQVASPSTGGQLVDTIVASSVIDRLREALVVRRAGAMFLGNLEGNLSLPRLTTSVAAGWENEGDERANADAVFDQVDLAPKQLMAVTAYSRKLLAQTSPDIEMLLRNDVATMMATVLDKQILGRDVSSKGPTELAAETGVNSVSVSGADGGPPTWATVVGLETQVAIDDALMSREAYITTPGVVGQLKTIEKAANTGMFLAAPDGSLNGYTCLRSNTVKHDSAKGSSGATLHSLIFGCWSQLIVGSWAGIDVMADIYTLASRAQVRLIGYSLFDTAVRHGESFAICNELTVT